MRRVPVVFAVLLLVLTAFAPVAAAGPIAGDGVAQAEPSAIQPADREAAIQSTDDGAPPDPESDRLGWENGYWHNETIDVDQSDGLTEAELNATVSRAMARVELIRGLEFDMEVPVEVVSRSEFASSSGTERGEAFRTFDNAKFEALLLIGEEEGSLDVQQDNSNSSIAGYYTPAEDAIVLVADNESTLQIDELTLGHELVHAIQDQEFDLGSFDSETRDGANADSGLIEGDANYVQYRYQQRCGEGGSWNGTCVTPEASGGGGGSGPPNMGVYFLNYQPYSDGPAFIADQRSEGGWAAVNDLYDAPPESAEQVIHPDRYGTDPPTEVELADEHGDGWERVRPESRLDYAEVGQSGVASMFAYPYYHSNGQQAIVDPREWLNLTRSGDVSRFDPLNYGFDAAAGWDGDRMHVYENADGETGYVWRLVWDSDAEAAEFRESYDALLDYWGAESVGENVYRIDGGQFADAFHVSVEGDTVTIVNAPTVGSLGEIRGSAGTPTETSPDPTPTSAETAEPSPTPDTETESPATTTTEAPGFSAVAALLAVLFAALLARRR